MSGRKNWDFVNMNASEEWMLQVVVDSMEVDVNPRFILKMLVGMVGEVEGDERFVGSFSMTSWTWWA